ncbi:nucleotide exchange factor GrpE [Lederbergia panacisoli]|uniref:nucleotide exchange factor GrpE n=1 Tax=Lederbergia panacisoli TaxID=1255251 RepID=UPI00214B4F24|nr:nucleotide exchange factor GrpE [Lederbergia panacisoli]MCR2820452.1 nucleotide exchange factor GrpE [Lederbergia panacisoli]
MDNQTKETSDQEREQTNGVVDETESVDSLHEENSNEAEAVGQAETLESEEITNNEEEVVDETALRISELEKKVEESENRYLRLYADFENFRRRSQLEREASEKYRSQSLITNLLSAIDNFERAMQIETNDEQAKALLDGVQMVYRNIIDVLKQEGAEQIEAVGQEFDPNFHQAVMQSNDPEMGSNIVVEEFQKGYKLKDRVIRPSMVKVNQ